MIKLSTLRHTECSLHSLNKYASLMTTGNGYMGVRASHEETCPLQTRGMYLAGLYHCAGKGETSELVNLPDLVGVQIELNGEIFTTAGGEIGDWQRELDFATGELTRSLIWRSPNGAHYRISSRRFASAAQLPLFAMTLTITPLNRDARVSLVTGIDATQTNCGRQHLDEVQLRVFGEHWLQGIYATQDGAADVAITSWCRVSGAASTCFTAKNRQLLQHNVANVAAGESITLEKLSWIAWSDDRARLPESLSQQGRAELERCVAQGYDALRHASDTAWQSFWARSRVQVMSQDPRDQQALDYALYHLHIMTPGHDERSSIAAKGLTGEGYKGHIFWDTEVFLLPFHLFSQPDIARRLLRYRWHNLPGARKKARQNGWQGALFPWESARSGDEETPEFAAINIRTGVRQKVASALAEHHLVADIAWAVVAYWHAARDHCFMAHEGLELLIDTAKFWISRAVEVNNRLEIHDVIGPDEYTEHVNNNAYTSYLAHYNVAQALHFARQFACGDEAFVSQAERFLQRLWLPQPQADGVLPQDDSFLQKPVIDLSAYKAKAGKQTILLDYSRAEVNEMQILKQADVVMLTYMLPELFTPAQCLANLNFYEPRTIHDSSLSKAIHGIVAAGCGDTDTAYRFWREGADIDLGDDPHACDDGIHAAATGAIWLGAIQGFAGLSVRHGELHLSPRLPRGWQQLDFPLRWQGASLHITLDAQQIRIRSTAPVRLYLHQQPLTVDGELTCALRDFYLPTTGTATTEGR
ncbi:glycoside hydrolase family 65 protein [Enterobacter sp. SA187]|uniref:glycoside hydrolase family 65 protein n=1 Tax=Enterobacter sp. SA187 TaxID=1914861 RepID=UPI0009347DB4|nr:glycoside hydrolase family 65 protein [Enterobacter sp. SA187]